MRSIFISEMFHMFHLGISNLVKEQVVAYLSSEYIMYNPGSTWVKLNPLWSYSMTMFPASNCLLEVIERPFPDLGLHMDLYSHEFSHHLDDVFVKLYICCMI